MKIHIVTGESFPNGMAATSRIRCYAGAVIKGGLDCEVIIYRKTERYGTKPMNTKASGICYGAPYRYIGGTPLRGRNKTERFISDILDKCRVLHYLKETGRKGDVVFAYAGLDVDYCIRLCKLAHDCGMKFGIELCELPYVSISKYSYVIKKRHRVEHTLMPMTDFIIPISEALENYARSFVSTECKMCRIPILVDFSKYDIDDTSSETDIPYIFHSGTLTEQKDGILGMIEAFGLAVKMMRSPIKFILAGEKSSSVYEKQIDDLILKYGLQDKINFTGYLYQEQLIDYLKSASLVIINKYETQQNRYGFSNKIGEYMAAGKALIISRVGEAMNWLHDGEDAVIVEPNNVDGMADAIIKVISDNEFRARLGHNAKAVCKESFDYKQYGRVMRDFFMSL